MSAQRDSGNEATALRAMRQLLDLLRVSEGDAGGPVSIEGEDFPEIGPHRLASVNAAAMAAHAVAVAAYWRMRGGRGQAIRIETARALQSLRSFFYLRQNGYPVGVDIHNAVSAFHRTADARWIYTYGHEHFLAPVLDLLNVPNTPAAVDAAIARWASGNLEEALAERRVPSSVVRTADEWLAHPQGRWLAQQPVIHIEKIGDSAPELPKLAERPLGGLRVLDCAHVLCGPMIARFLGEGGADVLRIRPAHQRDTDIVALDTAWGKRTALADFRNDTDREAMRALSAGADVLVQSYRPGALDRHGLSPADVAKLRPGIVYVSASCFGGGGPWGERGGYDPIAQAASGVAHTEALEGKPRQAKTVTINDYLAAYLGAAGAMGALIRRAREGGSYHVRVSLTRSSMWLQTFGLLPDAARHAHLPYADPVPPRLMTQATPFGMLTSLAPAVEYAATPAYWSRPPEPAGASQPVWLPR